MAGAVARRPDREDLRRSHDRPRRSPRIASLDRRKAVVVVSRHFTTIVVCDFEYEVEGGDAHLVRGDLPNVLCMVAHVLDANLQYVRTIRTWRGEFGSMPPFDIGPDTLFVAYSARAELTSFMTLGWKIPEHVFDLHTTY